DEDERGTRRKRLSQPHSRTDAGGFGRRSDRAENRLLARRRSQCSRAQLEPGTRAERCPEVEARDEEASDHANTCSSTTGCSRSTQPVTQRRICAFFRTSANFAGRTRDRPGDGETARAMRRTALAVALAVVAVALTAAAPARGEGEAHVAALQ